MAKCHSVRTGLGVQRKLQKEINEFGGEFGGGYSNRTRIEYELCERIQRRYENETDENKTKQTGRQTEK